MTLRAQLRDVLRALSWRLPWVKLPQEVGMSLRYTGTLDDAELNAAAWRIRARMLRLTAIGGVRLYAWRRYDQRPVAGWPGDPLAVLGSVGWAAQVRRP